MTRATAHPTTGTQELTQAQQRAEQLEKELQATRQTIDRLQSESSASAAKPPAPLPRAGKEPSDPLAQLRQEPMMAHLLHALSDGQDIGHYGRLVFAMVAHHFLSDEEMILWLTKDRDFSPEAATAMLRQVEGRDYNPPRRERILEWQREQDFPILPNPDDPDCGNVYRHLKFPQHVYQDIEDYQEKKADAAT